jgi:hypothetical protein
VDICARAYAIISYAECLAVGIPFNTSICTDAGNGLVTETGIVEIKK